jgi:hypothetical protein
MNIHVTAIRNGGVYGHTTDYCNESGCAAVEFFFKNVEPDSVEEHGVYELDESGTVVAEVE